MDKITPEHRSWNMGRIRSSNTKPELAVRCLLHRMGYRFRLHSKELPGKPDIVLPKYKTVVFVHGCFWHRHRGCPYSYMPKSRVKFWKDKFRETTERDTRKQMELESLGWKVLVVWECEIANLQVLADNLAFQINTGSNIVSEQRGAAPDRDPNALHPPQEALPY